MSLPRRILVLGATGMLGHEAVRVLSENFEVEATVRDVDAARSHGIDVELHELEAARPHLLPQILERARPDAVLNCIGIVKQLEEGSQPIPSIAVNSLFPHVAAQASREAGARFVHVSTDCVFSGELPASALYTEESVPDARDLYGRSKLLGEVGAPDVTLRTSIIGWELERASGLLEWLVSEAGNEVRGFANALFSGLTTRALAHVIARVLTEAPGIEGLRHVSSEPISKYDLLVALDRALELGCTVTRVEEPRINRALDSSRFIAETGIEIPPWPEMIGQLVEEREHEPHPR